LGDFKLFGSHWSPAPWLKVSSGNKYSGSGFGMPANGTPWPFIWLGNFAGGRLDVSGAPLADFDDSALGGAGPTSALTQFARCAAAYVRGFQRAYLAASNTALTVVLVNSSSNVTTVQVQAPPLPNGLTGFQSFTSDPGALWVSNSAPILNGVATVTVPGFGVCTLYGRPLAAPLPPAITQWPQSTNVTAGAAVRFSCVATGDAPLAFQWLFNNLPIPGAIGTALVLTNVQPFQAGPYAVQVANGAGSLTSFQANLGVSGHPTLPAITPQISVAASNSAIQFSFPANAGRAYSWLESSNLSSWTVATQFVSTASPARWSVPISTSSPPQYFRISSP